MIGTDFDRDGKRDITVWRPTEGKWYYLQSNSGFAAWGWWGWGG